jgi:hypothetical protein
MDRTYLYDWEIAALIGRRYRILLDGDEPRIEILDETDAHMISKQELAQRKLPLQLWEPTLKRWVDPNKLVSEENIEWMRLHAFEDWADKFKFE